LGAAEAPHIAAARKKPGRYSGMKAPTPAQKNRQPTG
jgi:hypothetical protein